MSIIFEKKLGGRAPSLARNLTPLLGRISLPSEYILLLNKEEATYETAFRKLRGIRTSFKLCVNNDRFRKDSINALENNFISVINCCFFHLSQNVYQKVQVEGFNHLIWSNVSKIVTLAKSYQMELVEGWDNDFQTSVLCAH